jgi:hypothetical protein
MSLIIVLFLIGGKEVLYNYMNNLTDLVCPQLFVQFRYIMKRNTLEAHTFKFCEKQDVSDILRYLNQHNFVYSFEDNILKINNKREEK